MVARTVPGGKTRENTPVEDDSTWPVFWVYFFVCYNFLMVMSLFLLSLSRYLDSRRHDTRMLFLKMRAQEYTFSLTPKARQPSAEEPFAADTRQSVAWEEMPLPPACGGGKSCV